jgi:trk system potassium uptake protein TrkA
VVTGRTDVHVVIMGCGRVGSALAHSLEDLDFTVAVIDQDPTSFRRLGTTFGGVTVTGLGFDRDVLVEAGIERADAFAAVSSGDNSNIIGARVARETFGVENVVARIYDPKRAAVYQRLGIPTVATVAWTADQMLRLLVPAGAGQGWRDPSGRIQVCEVHVGTTWVGKRLSTLEAAAATRIAFIERLGEGVVPDPDTVVQEGDRVYVVTTDDAAAYTERVFEHGPEGGH